MTKEQVLQQCTIKENTVYLPDGQLERKLYQDVAKSLELIGGKWKGGKVMGFVFPSDPTELLAEISGGEKRNLKKEFQFFATPDGLADKLVELAGIKKNQNVLEPSAGQGAIVKAVLRIGKVDKVYGYELMPVNRIFLEKIDGYISLGEDFMNADPIKFDRIIANPPFSKNQDIDHVMRMYNFLSNDGRMVAITSRHYQMSNNKKETTFKKWLYLLGAEIHEIPKGAFKESGTEVGGLIIVINK
jgi:hypothetical protein